MAVTVASLHRHPVKGLSPQPLDRVHLDEGGHFPGDRLYAIENGPAGYDPENPLHQPKIKYLMLMRNPRLAAFQTHYDDETGVLRFARNGKVVAEGDLTTAAGRGAIEAFLLVEFADELRGAPKVLTASGGYRFMDSAKSGFVSLLNLSSVRALAALAGRRTLDPARFRMNIALEGLPPWGEFDLIGKDIRVGGATLHVLKATDRCAAINAAPGIGLRDVDLIPRMEERLGHHDCGVYARVVAAGPVAVGDAVLGEAGLG
ncbi:MAG: MOSC domain-containing protein [Rhizobiaceae bacterium]